MTRVNARAWLSLAVLTLVVGLVLFGFAGTLRYWHAWVYLLLFVGMSGAITFDLMRRDPALLERRMKGGPAAEPRPLQRVLMLGASVGYFGLLIVPALDFRLKCPGYRLVLSSWATSCSCSGSASSPASIGKTLSLRPPSGSSKASA